MDTKSRKRPGKPASPGKQIKSTRVPVLLTQDEYDVLWQVAQDLGNIGMAEVLRADARAAGHLPSE